MAEVILIALAEGGLKIVRVGSKPSVHVGPRQEDGNGDWFAGRIFRVPAIDGDRVARFLVIVGKHRRKLLQHDVSGEFIPFVVIPGLGKECGVLARAYRIVPLPAG